MKQRRRKTTRSLIVALAVAAFAAPVAQAQVQASSERSAVVQPASSFYSSPAYHALMVRSEALNQKYHLGQYAYDPWFQALLARSKATDAKYGLNSSATVRHADDRAGIRGPGITQTPQVASSSDSAFNWGDASIGAGVAFAGAILLIGGVALSRRHRSQPLAV
jgi:hypothetical protein